MNTPYKQIFNNSLSCAVCDGELLKVEEIISSYEPFDLEGYLLLRDSIKYKHNNIAKLLLMRGSRVNRKNRKERKGRKEKHSKTPLHYAVANGDLELVKMLLDRGAITNARARCSIIPLHYAVANDKIEIVELLLNRGADANATCPIDISTRFNPKEQHRVTPLQIAAERGCLQIAGHLLKHGACVNASTPRKGYTPLHIAARKGSVEIVKLLLISGASIDAKGKDSTSPIYHAVEKGYEEVVKLLLEKGANVNTQDQYGITILHFAVQKGYSEIVGTILKYCPDIINEINRASLKYAVHGSKELQCKIVESLLQYGFTVGPKDVNQWQLLHAAIEKGYLEIVEQFLKLGINVNYQFYTLGCSLLHVAVKNRQEEIVKLLKSYGVDVNATDQAKHFPIYYAVQNNDIKLTKWLSDNGAKTEQMDSLKYAVHGSKEIQCEIVESPQYGFTVSPKDVNQLQLLHDAIEKGYLKIVEQFLKRSINVDQQFYTLGCSLLHVAVKNRQEEIVKLLKSYGVDVNATDQANHFPIYYAVQNNDIKLTKWLLDNGAKIKHTHSLLHTAVRMEYREIIEVLLTHVDINARDNYGNTALHFTSLYQESPHFQIIYKRDPEIVKLLLNRGADVNAKNEKGTTALHLATQGGFVRNVKVLLKYGAKVDSKDFKNVTPLLLAADHLCPKIVPILLEFGANTDSKDEWGRTALHIAAKNRHGAHVSALLDYGCDINSECRSNHTALYYLLTSLVSINDKRCECDDNPKHDIFFKNITASVILEKEIFKIKFANRYLNKKNLLGITKTYESQYFQEYEEEIRKMKSEKICNSGYSFYDILKKSVNELAICVENKNIVNSLKLKNYKIIFPIYGSFIQTLIRSGERRKKLLVQGCQFFHLFFDTFPVLPEMCTEKIFSYLSDEDLRVLIDVCNLS